MKGYVAFPVDLETKAKLLALYPYAHDKLFGEHITVAFGVHEMYDVSLEQEIVFCARHVNEYADVFSVTVDGTSVRHDGKPYHLTWSMLEASGKGPKYSVDALDTPPLSTVDDIKFRAKPIFYTF